jgi:purine-binding chemotaxis protein CheW
MAENKYVIFRLGEEKYGIPIESVERILPDQSVTKLPRTPKMFLGVFEIRGETIPAIDARLRFDMEPAAEAKNFVVVMTGEGRCALRVDSVDGILNFDESEVDDSPELFESKNDAFMHGVGKKGSELTVLIDPTHVVPSTLKSKLQVA